MLDGFKNNRFYKALAEISSYLISRIPALPVPSTISTIILLGASFFVILAGTVFVAYLSSVVGFKFEPSDLGTLGDFVGGLLNPLLTFISIGFIAYTLYQNSVALKLSADELRLTREEMELARREHAKSSAAHEGMLNLERDNIAKREAMIILEGSRIELKYRMGLLSKRLNSRSYQTKNTSKKVSLNMLVNHSNICMIVGVTQISIFELKDTLSEACIMGRILQQYISSGKERELGRELYLRAGELFWIALRALATTSLIIELPDGGTIKRPATSHELLIDELVELSGYTDRFNKKMLLTQ
jgi:hypothetical protein